MLYILGGLPGTGKSTLAVALARRYQATYLRIDTIEQAIRDSGLDASGPAGYIVGYQLALDNLRLGSSVVADSVNPLNITRKAWRDVAAQTKVPYVEIEIICSVQEEHHTRVETRQSNIPGFKLPLWSEVLEHQYEEWKTEHIVLDTAGHSPDESAFQLFNVLVQLGVKS